MTQIKPDRLRLPNLTNFPATAEAGDIVIVNGQPYLRLEDEWKAFKLSATSWILIISNPNSYDLTDYQMRIPLTKANKGDQVLIFMMTSMEIV